MAGPSQPGDFGATPWGKAWIKRVQPLTVTRPNALLPKGRSLARSEAVGVDHLEPGSIRCSVTVRGKVDQVSIKTPTYSAKDKRAVTTLVESSGSSINGSGDLPDALYAQLVQRDLEPLPASTSSACTCKARADPCIHVIAATYAISLSVDQSPTQALTFRGFDTREHNARAAAPMQRWIPIDDVDIADYFGTV